MLYSAYSIATEAGSLRSHVKYFSREPELSLSNRGMKISPLIIRREWVLSALEIVKILNRICGLIKAFATKRFYSF